MAPEHSGQSGATDLGTCMSYYCSDEATRRVRRYGVDEVLCEKHAKEPITCPKCGSSSPCWRYGPGCP